MQNKGYSADWLYQLKSKNDVVSIVSRYVHLEKKGKSFWGCCPFHNEKTPSFSVNQEDGFYHCFGCKESGDVITFVQKMESCDFSDAVKILAENAHMEIPAFSGDKDTLEKKQTRDRLLKVLDAAFKHYQENLYLPVAKPAQQYIKLRGFTRRELDDFKLGYSINWDEMVSYLKSKGFSFKEMVDAGVVQNKNDHYFDPLSGRLIFPIFNNFNECVGFSARALEKVDFAKYLNTSETTIFQKRRVLFGFNILKALKHSGGLNNIIVVEGQIDVIAMHRAGFKQTVACLGSALTVENARELKKVSTNVILCFDGDTAGEKATLNSIEILKNEGFNIKIVALPDKQDPDEVLKNHGKEFMENLIGNALPVTDYLIEVEKKKYNLKEPESKGQFIKAVLAHLRKLATTSEAEPYLDKLRDLTSVPIDILRRDLISATAQPATEKQKEEDKVIPVRENGDIKAVKFILASLIHQKSYVDKNIDFMKLLPSYVEIIQEASKGTPISCYFDIFDVNNMPLLQDAIMFDFEAMGQTLSRYYDECVWLLAEESLFEKQKTLTEKYNSREDLDERKEILKQISMLTKQLKDKSLEDFYVR